MLHRLPRVLFFPLAAMALSLTGCASHPAAQVPASLRCEPPAALLAPCAAPVALKPGLTYREMLDAHLADRQQLQRCAAQQDELRRALNSCNARIDAHNAELVKAAARKP
ncbi:hypothetical protein [uncultured Sphaerotilus sp.]|uniref:Rz1-like lysis system protein LysC n=1 Tax=uncultured Sphaerotilus sp. TaxID=474984 RepID=UPI0030CA5A4F